MQTVEAVPPVVVQSRREPVSDGGAERVGGVEVEQLGVDAGERADDALARVPDREFDEGSSSTLIPLGNDIAHLDLGVPEDVAAELDDKVAKPLEPVPVVRELADSLSNLSVRSVDVVTTLDPRKRKDGFCRRGAAPDVVGWSDYFRARADVRKNPETARYVSVSDRTGQSKRTVRPRLCAASI